MIDLMSYAVSSGLARNEGDYWAQIGFPRTAISMIRNGTQSFRVPYIINACNLTGASADWVLGISPDMFRRDRSKPVIDTLREMVAEMEGRQHKPQKWIDKQIVKNIA